MRSQSSVCKCFKILVLIAVLVLERNDVFAQSSTAPEIPKEKILRLFIRINAPIDSVWSRWSSEKGIKKFFAPACRLELKTFGRLDILFAPNAPEGKRGAENNLILAVQDKKMISFTWDAPSQWPEIRKCRTVVSVRFYQTTNSETLVTLTQAGWGVDPSWDAVYNYFEKAWSGFVLPNLKYSLEVKPVDWQNVPTGLKQAEPIASN